MRVLFALTGGETHGCVYCCTAPDEGDRHFDGMWGARAAHARDVVSGLEEAELRG